MAIYNISGTSISACYNISGTALSVAYDISGNQVYTSSSSSVDPMDWSSMTDYLKANINSVIEYVQSYVAENTDSYAFPVITDTHDQLYNEPNYVLYYYPDVFEKFLFLGDIATAFSQTQMDNALAYMEEAKEAGTMEVLPLVGNHEFGGWTEDDYLPREWYASLLPSDAVTMSADELVYYYDDTNNNVRFICLDSCTPIYTQSGSQKYTKNELEFLASALESATGNVIVLNHAPGQSYYDLGDTSTSNSTTTVTNVGVLSAILNAFIDRTTYTLTDDSSVEHTHDYTECTGSVIGLICGHTHHGGWTNNNGYNVFVCPSEYYNSDSGMSVFIVDPDASKVIHLIAYRNNSTYDSYEYTF